MFVLAREGQLKIVRIDTTKRTVEVDGEGTFDWTPGLDRWGRLEAEGWKARGQFIGTPGAFRDALLGPGVTDGGRARYFTTADGFAVSFAGAAANAEEIARGIQTATPDRVIGIAVNWDRAELYCAATGEQI